jgi:hypothetical protein
MTHIHHLNLNEKNSGLALEDGKILQHRNYTDNDHDHANDLLRAPVDRQHVDEIEHEDDDKERD